VDVGPRAAFGLRGPAAGAGAGDARDRSARLVEVFREANVADSGGRWFRIACEADWPATGEATRFVSEPVPTDPTPQLARRALTVRVDPADQSNFAVILA
jgi:hypothetical protein